MEAGSQDDAKLVQLADFWLFEHLLVLPSSIATDEIVSHLGAKFPHRDTENGALPAPVSARLFLRHLRSRPTITDWQELLELLGLFCMLSCKRHQFRSREAAKAVCPRPELLIDVLMQVLRSRADPSSDAAGEQSSQQQLLQPLDASAVQAEAERLMEDADVMHIQDDEVLQNKLSLLEQLLQGRLSLLQLHTHLHQAFPADAVEEALREYLDKAWQALGPTTLQLHQQSVLSGRQLPYDPMQHFAALLPVATQDALDAAAAAAAGAGASPAAQQQQQAARAAGPVALLGKATAPLLGTEELAAVLSSSDAKRAGRGRQQRERPAAAPKSASQPAASPSAAAAVAAAAAPAAAAASAGDTGGGADGANASRKPRGPRSNKSAKEIKQEAVPAAGGKPSRKQLQLAPTNTAAPAAAATAVTAAAAAEDTEGAEAPAAAAAGDGGKKGRRSKQQQQQQQNGEEGSGPAAAAAAGNENLPPLPAAGSGERKRGRKPTPPAGAAAAAGAPAGAGDASGGSQPNVMDGVEPAAAAASGGQDAATARKSGSGSLAAAFMQVLNKPLDGLAAAAGGLAAAVRGSPGSAARKDRKLCGARPEGVKGRTVPWESPFGGSSASPEGTSKGKPAKSPKGAAAPAAAAAAGGPTGRPIANALKRKRAQAEGHKGKGPVAAAKAAGAGAVDSGNTEYQDAREEAGSEEQSGEPLRRSPRQHKHRRHVDDDSSIDDPDSEEEYTSGSESEDDSDLEEEGRSPQQHKRHKDHHHHHSKHGQHKKHRQPAAAAGRGAGAAAAAAAGGGGGYSPHRRQAVKDADGRRRKFTRWSAEEEQLLIQLVAQEGEGQWARILKLGEDGFNEVRNQVDLKDKWRNLKKKGAL